MSDRRPVVLADEGRFADAGSGVEMRRLAAGDDTNGAYDLVIERAASGTSTAGRREVETGLHVLRGTVRITAGGTVHDLAAGEFLHVPAGMEVGIANLSGADAEYLVLQAPARAVEGGGPPRAEAVRRGADDGRCVGVVGDVYRFLATGAETDGRYALWEAIVPPGGGPPPHFHTREEECFLVLEGEVTFLVGDVWRTLGAGCFANMPPGFHHAFANRSDRPARMLIGAAPAGLEAMFFEMGDPLPNRETPAPHPTPEFLATLPEVCARYGIQLLPPPGA